jgi:hypothetical protein
MSGWYGWFIIIMNDRIRERERKVIASTGYNYLPRPVPLVLWLSTWSSYWESPPKRISILIEMKQSNSCFAREKKRKMNAIEFQRE